MILTSLFATYTGILTSGSSTAPHGAASAYYGTLPYHRAKNAQSEASVQRLASLHFRCSLSRPVSYYALFKGWLLLSQPPGCFGSVTPFHT